jgi:hypothetical protein
VVYKSATTSNFCSSHYLTPFSVITNDSGDYAGAKYDLWGCFQTLGQPAENTGIELVIVKKLFKAGGPYDDMIEVGRGQHIQVFWRKIAESLSGKTVGPFSRALISFHE